MANVPSPKPSVRNIGEGTSESAAESVAKRHGFRRKLVGQVTSNKMDKTVTVEVVHQKVDQKYKKYVTARARYKAHDEKNEYIPGDKVEIQEHRPLSKNKRWVVIRLLSRSADMGVDELKDEVLGLK